MFKRSLLLLASVVSLNVMAVEPTSRTVTETFQDWQVVCAEKNNIKVCEARQKLVNQSQQTVALLTMGKGKDNKVVLQIALPHMLDLTKSVQISVESKKGMKYPFKFCNAAACFAVIEEEDKLFPLFNKANDGTLEVVPFGKKSVKFNFSLKGFSAALKSLEVNNNFAIK